MSKLAEFLRADMSSPATSATNADKSRKSRKSRSLTSVDSEMQSACTSTPVRPPVTAGRLVTCETCLHFLPRAGELPDGRCRRFDTETWGGIEISCRGFEAKDAAHRVREIRRAKVEGELRSHPEKRLAFDVVDAPLQGGAGAPVSVLLAVRHGSEILSGELHVPRDNWNPGLFLAAVISENCAA